VIDAFLDGLRSGFSADLHIEGDTLLAERTFTFGARVGSRSLLIRADIPQDLSALKDTVEAHLRSEGLKAIQPDCPLGDIAAIQVTGIRGGVWDLWGDDPQQAQQDLESSVLGTDGTAEAMNITLVDQTAEDAGIGMTLEELVGKGGDSGGDELKE